MGPKGSPYEGGRFDIRVRITKSFPEEEPKVDFKTKIFHPQVLFAGFFDWCCFNRLSSENGRVCLCLLRKKWNPSMTIKDVIDYLENMLYCPALDAHASSEASKLFESDHAEFVKVAQEATRLFAIERRDSP